MKLDIGSKIKQVVEDRGLSVTEFAKRINTSRNNAYAIFERHSIDTDLLYTISAVLQYDFFKLYCLETSSPISNEKDGSTSIQKLLEQKERLEKVIDSQLESLKMHSKLAIEKDKELADLKRKIGELEERMK